MRSPLFFLLFLICAVVINVVLDILFIALFGMGVAGAAYATVVSQAASGVACLVYIRARVPALRLRRGDLRPNLRLPHPPARRPGRAQAHPHARR